MRSSIFGGIILLKFLITCGEVPEAVVDTLNHLQDARTMEKRGTEAGEEADSHPGGFL